MSGRLWRRLTMAAPAIVSAVVVAQQPQPVFKAGVTHVLLDVVVTDKDDKPITDLTAEDFEIREGGRPQAIADFDRIAVPLGHRSVDLGTKPGAPPDVASNEAPPHAGRAFVFLMDNLTLEPGDLEPIRRVMADFLRTLAPDDEVALTYVTRSDLGTDFTRDPGRAHSRRQQSRSGDE